MHEEAVMFSKGHSLIGVVTYPKSENKSSVRCGVIFLNAGLVHHIGQNQIYVKTARKLAGIGCVSLRFDLSGIGDSDVNPSNLNYQERVRSEIQDAIELLCDKGKVDRVILIGFCSGAINGLNMVGEDERIKGLVLVNPSSPIRKRFILRSHLINVASWKKIMTSINYYKKTFIMLKQSLKIKRRNNEHSADYINHMKIANAINHNIKLSIVISQRDPSLDQILHELRKLEDQEIIKEFVETNVIQNADHDFYLIANQKDIIECINRWIEQSFTYPPSYSAPDYPPQMAYKKTLAFIRNLI